MTATLKSKLEVMALAHDHYRILRDNATRAQDYLNRFINRGGQQLDKEWWVDLPEPVSCLCLGDLMTGLTALVTYCGIQVEEIKDTAEKVAQELNLTDGIGAILYRLVEAQHLEIKARAREEELAKITQEDLEEEWFNRDSIDPDSPVLDSMQYLPPLGEDQQYELVGKEIINGKERAKWEIVDTPKKSSVTEKSNEKPKLKTVLYLKRRPRT